MASRRASERLITAGRVTVDGRTITDLGTRVEPGEVVRLDGEIVTLPSSFTYILLNKPAGYVVTLSDPQGRRTVADLIKDVEAHVVPVGRLDVPTEGLIILTDDGDVAHRVTHPSFEIDKVYEVLAGGVLEEEDVRKLEEGVELDGRKTSPARVRVLSRERSSTRAEVTIHEGWKRQVRRMFEEVGHPVRKLVRVRIGPLELGSLPSGSWRHMTYAELTSLRDALGLGEH